MYRKSKSGGGVTRCVPNGIVLWRLLVKIGPADWQLGIEPCSLSAVLRSWGHPEPTFFCWSWSLLRTQLQLLIHLE